MSIVVPSKIATPHDMTGTYVGATNRVLDANTVPVIWGLNANDVILATTYCRNLTITVKDQYNALVGDVYPNAVITEDAGGGLGNLPINQVLTTSSTYADANRIFFFRPGGPYNPKGIFTRGGPEASAWPLDPTIPMTNQSPISNHPAVQVDGFSLNPGYGGRTIITLPPNDIGISW